MISLSSRPVRDIMSKDVVTVSTKTILQEAARKMSQNRVDCLVVLQGKKPVGMLTERDFVKLIEKGQMMSPKLLVQDVVSKNLLTITPSTKFSKAFSLMNRYGYKQLPVVYKGNLKGILTLQQLLVYSRNNLVGAIEENRNLERKVNYDSLTGVFNKRFLSKRVKEEYDRCIRYGIRTSVIFIDIDHFKRINDTFSHAAGDYVLKSLGKILKENARSMDVIARYGGEEFVLITPSTNSPEAAILAQKIRLEVEKHHFTYRKQRIDITISAGVASFSSANSAKQAMERADKALYYAKQHGRNMVCRWQDSVNKIEIVTSVS